MKNQYFGDTRDLFKFDLIEEMLKDTTLDLKQFLYIIMLTKDEGKGGGKRDFEKAKEEERPGTKNDKDLIPLLKKQKNESKNRDIANTMKEYYHKQCKGCLIDAIDELLEKANKTEYFNKIYMRYFKKVYEKISQSKKSTLIFLDPDTGLEPEASKGKKYVSYETLDCLFNSMKKNSIIMIYQHGLWKLNFKKDALKEITSYITSITDNEIVFFFLAKSSKQIESVLKVLKKYHQRYPKTTNYG